LLDRGYEVHAITLDREFLHADVTVHHLDLLNDASSAELFALVRPSHMLHLAWYVEHGKFWEAPENAAWVDASIKLVKGFAANGGKRVVFSGTCAEYDWDSTDEIFSELTSPTRPRSAYGRAKNDLHAAIQQIAPCLDLSYAWGRIFFLFGRFEPRERFIPYTIRALSEDREALCSQGTQIRDFMYIDDAGEAFAQLLDSNVEGPVNIASGVGRSLQEVGHAIAELLSRPHLLKFGARESSTNEPASIVADVARLRDDVGFIPRFDLMTGLERTIDWWKGKL